MSLKNDPLMLQRGGHPPEGFGNKVRNFSFPPDNQGQCRRLDTSDRQYPTKPQFPGFEGKQTRHVHTDKPVCSGPP